MLPPADMLVFEEKEEKRRERREKTNLEGVISVIYSETCCGGDEGTIFLTHTELIQLFVLLILRGHSPVASSTKTTGERQLKYCKLNIS